MASSSTNPDASPFRQSPRFTSREQQQGSTDGLASTTVDHAKLISDKEDLEKEVAALDAECKEYHSKRIATTGLVHKVTSRSPKSKKEIAAREGKLDQMQDLLLHKAKGCYDKTKELYANDYDKIARAFSQRVRYERYGIVLQTSGEAWENVTKILPALYDKDLERRRIILDHLWRQIGPYAKDVRKDAERVYRERPSGKAASSSMDQPDESDAELTPLVRRYIEFSDKLMEYRHLAKQIELESRKDLVPTEELKQVKKDYLRVLGLLNEMGAVTKYRLEGDVFEDLDKSGCRTM